MKMEITRIKPRACLALLLAILCCGCERSSSGSGESKNSTEAESADDAVWRNATRVEETDMDTVFGDGWVHANTAHDWIGDTAAVTSDLQTSMSFNFTGNRIRWIGWRESGAGIARILIDGESAGKVDLYSNTIAVQAPVFASKELEQGPHTLTIKVDGTANRKSSGSMVVVDAFEILSTDETPRPSVTRIEETSSSLSFTGEWLHGDDDVYTNGPDALVSFSFTGTRVRWLSHRKPAAGIARIFLDGEFVGEVDLYSSIISAQVPVFTSAVLAQGPHTLLIEATGAANPAATSTFVAVDAFDVVP